VSISPSIDQPTRGHPYRTRVVRTIDEVTPELADLRLAAGANFNYGQEFLRGYEYEPIQPVSDLHYLEVRDTDDALIAAARGFGVRPRRRAPREPRARDG
jgi:hypothetical protein